MGFPPIDPTGAMASGDYVNYMLQYNAEAADYILQQLQNFYYDQNTINKWESTYSMMLEEVEEDVVEIGLMVSGVQQKILMINNILEN